MSIKPPTRPSPYVPANSHPLRLANATIQAVDQLGLATAGEIEKTADEILQGATEIATKLHELAVAIRQHTEMASEHVAGFCDRATSIFDGVVELQQKLTVNAHRPNDHKAPSREENDDEF